MPRRRSGRTVDVPFDLGAALALGVHLDETLADARRRNAPALARAILDADPDPSYQRLSRMHPTLFDAVRREMARRKLPRPISD